jgi:hypothetical protein
MFSYIFYPLPNPTMTKQLPKEILKLCEDLNYSDQYVWNYIRNRLREYIPKEEDVLIDSAIEETTKKYWDVITQHSKDNSIIAEQEAKQPIEKMELEDMYDDMWKWRKQINHTSVIENIKLITEAVNYLLSKQH